MSKLQNMLRFTVSDDNGDIMKVFVEKNHSHRQVIGDEFIEFSFGKEDLKLN